MKAEDRAAFIDRFLEEHCRGVMATKGTEYSRGEEDVNSNFARGAEIIGADQIAVLYVYLSKHLDSIAHYVKTRETPSGEGIMGRIGDAVNYLLILASMIDEQTEQREVVQWVFGETEPQVFRFHIDAVETMEPPSEGAEAAARMMAGMLPPDAVHEDLETEDDEESFTAYEIEHRRAHERMRDETTDDIGRTFR